ncbi:MAG TPA: superinfection immunity protein [Candidatus Melainabacteria bacterium]|nr:superinfection immunity protein [Candidatus Melainabacteria bacterium]
MALLVGIYILPTIVAFYRKKRNRWNIAFFNIVLGWTVIAWGAMIVECFKSDDAP